MRFEFSAGGIVYKREGKQVLILIAQHSSHNGWVFPKGLIGDRKTGETKKEAALREVEEETGVKAEIVKPLNPISFWYVWEKERRKKTVYYFLMKYISGDITRHDHEMQKVEWLPDREILERLTYINEKRVFKEALQYFKD